MVTKEIQKRNEKAQTLRVVYVEDDLFFVDSEKGKICYRIIFSDEEISCTCGDFVKNIKSDKEFRCKHIFAVIGAIKGGSVEEGQVMKKVKPQLNEKFITKIKGKEFILYAGLLDLGTQLGIRKIHVEALQFPTKENGMEAICKATVESKLGEVYIEVGDASPKNVNKMIAPHILRMAATRAKCRCLRDYTVSHHTALEELGNLDDVIEDTKPAQPGTKKKAPAKPKVVKSKNDGKPDAPKDRTHATSEETSSNNETPKMSDAQHRAIANLSRRRGISLEEVENMSKESYGVTLVNLSASDASSLIRELQQAA
jgi:hypothetical protein